MSAFDKIIGYETIKKELMQICDMFHNKQKYEGIGAKLINGILIYGDAGVGKTALSKCFIEESGAKSYTIDKSFDFCKFAENFPDFLEEVKQNAPAIVFLDDLDDYTEAIYNILQVEFDNISDLDVLVIATANEINNIPDSLLRTGRFGRKIEVCLPTEQERSEIFKHYTKDKKIDDINYEDLIMMCGNYSCADIKTIVNEAAINAVFSGRDIICMKDFVEVCLRRKYVSPDVYALVSEDDLRKTAIHEAGHLVVSEIICPDSVGLVSVRTSGNDNLDGFIRKNKTLPERSHDILVCLGGKAAVELYFSETCASGCYADLRQAVRKLRHGINANGTCGLGMIDVDEYNIGMSENMNARNEAVVHAELERYVFKAREILQKNREFLEKATELLLEKSFLLHSDIKELRESVTITNVAV